MARQYPITRAVHALREADVAFEPRLYDYVARGGTHASAEALGVDEHAVIKTLIFEDDRKQPFIVLMHGDRQVSAKQLARVIGAKRVAPCEPKVADRHSGYQVGGTSPFGTRRAMPAYMERTIADLDRVLINGGSRGFLVEISPADLSEDDRIRWVLADDLAARTRGDVDTLRALWPKASERELRVMAGDRDVVRRVLGVDVGERYARVEALIAHPWDFRGDDKLVAQVVTYELARDDDGAWTLRDVEPVTYMWPVTAEEFHRFGARR